MSAAWKEAERLVARMFLGAKGVRVVRHKGGKGADFGDIGILLEDGSIKPPSTVRVDVKHEKNHPQLTAWRSMKKSADKSRTKGTPDYPIPVVVLRETGSPRTMVVVAFEDIKALAKVLPDDYTRRKGS